MKAIVETATENVQIDGQTLIFDSEGGAYPPELYRPAGVARQARDLKSIAGEDLRFYAEAGYLSVAAAFGPAEVGAALEGLIHLIMGGNPDFKGVLFEGGARDILPTLGLEERQDAVRKLGHFVQYEPRLHALAHHPDLWAVLRKILGEEPVLYADQAMLKPPQLGREKPWHQDLSYFNYAPETKIVGVWIALDEATVENGCMQVLPGWHRKGPILHFKKRDWQICDTAVLGQNSVAAPLKPGGLLFFDGLIPHGTPRNKSGQRRRALQFHYHGVSARTIAATERMAVFGSEGKDASC